MRNELHNQTMHVALSRRWARVLTVGAALAALALATGCKGGAEGDRCNPLLVNPQYNEDECDKGLACQTPSGCPESYCCPPDGGASGNPLCQPGCGLDAGGAGDAGDDAGGDAGANEGAADAASGG
jgi:hypothetical protein